MNSKNTVAVVKSHTSVEFHPYIKRVPNLDSAIVAVDRDADVSLVVAVNEDVDGGFLVHMYLQSPKEIEAYGLAPEKQELELRPGSPYLGNLIKGFIEGIDTEHLIEISSGRMTPGWVKQA